MNRLEAAFRATEVRIRRQDCRHDRSHEAIRIGKYGGAYFCCDCGKKMDGWDVLQHRRRGGHRAKTMDQLSNEFYFGTTEAPWDAS